MHFTAAMSGGWRSKGSEVATGLLIPPALLFGTKSSRHHRHQFLPNCELVVEPQQVVLGQTKATDGCFGFQTTMWPMPIVAMEPAR